MVHEKRMNELINQWKAVKEERDKLYTDVVKACELERDYGPSLNPSVYQSISDRMEDCSALENSIVYGLMQAHLDSVNRGQKREHIKEGD